MPAAELPVTGATERSGDSVAAGNGIDLTVSAERLQITTEWMRAGRVRLRRQIETDTRTVEVTLRREVLVVEHLPATDTPVAATTEAVDREPVVIVLRQEVPEIGIRVQAYERVTARVERVTEDQLITDNVRHEGIAFDDARKPPTAR